MFGVFRGSLLTIGAAFCCAFSLPAGAFAAETVSLTLANAPIAEVLRNLAELGGENLVLSGDVKGTVSANLDGVTAEEAIEAVLRAGGYASARSGKTLIVYGGEKKTGAKGAESFRLSYADAEEVAKALGDFGENADAAAVAGANTVIVTGTPAELLSARDIISKLDIPEKQVKVEAEVVAVNKSNAKELGIDWDFKSLTGSASYSHDNWDEEVFARDEDGNILYTSSGYPRSYSVEHRDWEVTIPDGYAGISYGRSAAGHPYTFFFQAKLNALVSEGKARVLAKPNVVTMNGRKAEILIGSRIPVVVEHLENGVKTTATEYKDAGIKLSYTPRISAKDEITADVRAEVSTPYLVPEMKAYRIVTRQADTLVRLKSGEELVIGGLIDKETSTSFRKVPILGDIPILGKLFQSKSKSEEESEIIIVIRAELIE